MLSFVHPAVNYINKRKCLVYHPPPQLIHSLLLHLSLSLLSLYIKVLDPVVMSMPGGNYKIWFKDIRAKGQTGAAISSDLVNWHRLTDLEVKPYMHVNECLS